jgi:hypothetical protein
MHGGFQIGSADSKLSLPPRHRREEANTDVMASRGQSTAAIGRRCQSPSEMSKARAVMTPYPLDGTTFSRSNARANGT